MSSGDVGVHPGLAEGRAPERFSETMHRLRAAQKSGKGPAYLRYVNRRLGRPMAAAAYQVGLTPDMVTVISGTFTFSGLALLALLPPSWALGAVCALLLLTGFALDSADGQLARLRGGGSLSGEWLDHAVDAVKVSAFHLVVLLSLHRSGELGDGWLLVPIGFSLVGAVAYCSNLLSEQLIRNNGGDGRPPGDRSARSSLLLLPTDYGVLCMTFFLMGSIPTFLAAYGTMFALSTVHVVVSSSRRFSEVRAIDRRRAA